MATILMVLGNVPDAEVNKRLTELKATHADAEVLRLDIRALTHGDISSTLDYRRALMHAGREELIALGFSDNVYVALVGPEFDSTVELSRFTRRQFKNLMLYVHYLPYDFRAIEYRYDD